MRKKYNLDEQKFKILRNSYYPKISLCWMGQSGLGVYTRFFFIIRGAKRPRGTPRPRNHLSVRDYLSVREVPPGKRGAP